MKWVWGESVLCKKWTDGVNKACHASSQELSVCEDEVQGWRTRERLQKRCERRNDKNEHHKVWVDAQK